MRSHRYSITRSDATRAVLAPILALICIVVAAHASRFFNFPSAITSSEYLEDIIIHDKQAAANSRMDPDVLFVGDSSCLMDFSSRELERLVAGEKFYNLGTLSTLGLAKFGEFTASFLARHTNVETVVLLISPEMVRSGSADPAVQTTRQHGAEKELDVLRDENSRIRERLRKEEAYERILPDALALPFMKTQWVARVFESPYEGTLGNVYGFAAGVREFMAAQNGSAVDPSGEYRRSGPVTFETQQAGGFASEHFRAQCAAFRNAIPEGVKLLVGMTPEPVTACGTNRNVLIQRTLLTLKEYLRADDILTNLRTSLPDHYFSTTTHLNPRGARLFTHDLAAVLERHKGFARIANLRAVRAAQGRPAQAEVAAENSRSAEDRH